MPTAGGPAANACGLRRRVRSDTTPTGRARVEAAIAPASTSSTRKIPLIPGDPRPRCPWCGTAPAYVRYHDLEWGVPVHEDRLLFEFITLEGAQAGLSWSTILNKRARYRRAFAAFDPAKVARFTPARVDRLLADPGIVRNRLKVESTIGNARAFLAVQEAHGSFDAYLWHFAGGAPIVNRWLRMDQVPARTPLSDALAKDLARRGFRFVGSTIVYAFMQAVGVVNDHLVSCFRHRELDAAAASPGGHPDTDRRPPASPGEAGSANPAAAGRRLSRR